MPTRRAITGTLLAMPVLSLIPNAIGVAAGQSSPLKGDTVETSAGPVVLHPISHATLAIGFGDQVIYVDPVGGAAASEGLPAPTAILITHQHGDHFDLPTLQALPGDIPLLVSPTVLEGLPEDLKSRATALANGESGTLAGLPVEAVPAYNTTADRLQYHPKGVGNGYVLTFGDKRIYIAGDTEDIPEMRALTDIEVAFLPMNLPFTMTAEQAADAVQAFKPAVVYPYHYRGSDTEAFARLVGDVSEVRLIDWYQGA